MNKLTTIEAAKRLGVTPHYLQQLRQFKFDLGPPWHPKNASRGYYLEHELDDWVKRVPQAA